MAEQGYDRREFLRFAGGSAVAIGALSQLELAEAIAQAEAETSAKIGNKAIRQLRRSVKGRVLTPGEGGYGKARKVYNTRYNHIRPPAVVEVKNVADVQEVMRWASRHEVRVTARSGGHSYAGYSTSANGVVVDLSRLGWVSASNGSRRATVGAGVPLIKMYSKLAKRGMTVPGGSCPTVGVTGLALGGGMGFASRKFGMTCDNIVGVGIVTPDGRYLKVDSDNNSGLLWACQGGGGGNFGIVTSLTFKTHRVKRAAYYHASWPWEQADRAFDSWQRFAPETTSDLCSVFSLLTGSGSPHVVSSGQFFGSERKLRRLLRSLEQDGLSLTVGSEDYLQLMLRWAACGESVHKCQKPNRTAFYAASDYAAKPLNSRGRKQLLGVIEDRQSEGGSGAILLDAYGGAINKVGSRATAFVHRGQRFGFQYYAQPGGSSGKSTGKWIEKAKKRMRRYVSGEAYQNYIDPKLKGWKRAYYGKNYERLRDVKTRYDPDNRLRFRQGIQPRK